MSFTPDDHTYDAMAGVAKAMKLIPQGTQENMLSDFRKGIEIYPEDCYAKEVLKRVLDSCTKESAIHFMLANIVLDSPTLKELGIDPKGPKVLRLLKDEKGNPVFWKVCEEVKKEIAAQPEAQMQVDEGAGKRVEKFEDRVMQRRSALKLITGAGVMAMGGELVLGGWTKEDGGVNQDKVIRVVLEAAATYSSAKASAKQYGYLMASKIIDNVAADVEKEIGVPAAPARSKEPVVR